ncbi:uncharacterized protein LOC131936507 isoform X3 [Physella acuta]|uniref:uncharacterized protein LOC131936507 isoform X3 n=1 Tax=Physella acuta TaxID=109671 RepID=UPI0027DBEC88|nr:uncharacterized protein LOC131936507 isoform X3 [Physella acuta]
MSADQEWRDALTAGMNNDGTTHTMTSNFHPDFQTDFLPSSTHSPGRSPQASPDSQQPGLLHGQSPLAVQHHHPYQGHPANNGSQQDQHVSQSGVPPSNLYTDPADPAHSAGQLPSKMTPQRQNIPQGAGGQPTGGLQPQGFPSRNQQHVPRPVVNSAPGLGQFSQPQNRMIRPPHPQHVQHQPRPGPNGPVRHPQSQPMSQRPMRPPQPPHLQQQRPQFTNNPGVRPPQSPRMGAPGHPQNMVRPNVPQPPNNAGFRPMSQNRPPNPVVGGAANIGHAQNMRPPAMAGQQQRPYGSYNHPPLGRGTRMPFPHEQQGSSQGHQGQAQHRPGAGPDNPEHQMSGYEDEDMYYDEDDDYDEEMEAEEEEMFRQKYPQFQYPDSDSDDISEEESALLEELAVCEDEHRYEEIVSQLQEKGVDADELDEMMYNRNLGYGQNMFPMENYDEDEDEYGDEEEDEEEEQEVSSSSQGQMGFHQNMQRPPNVRMAPRGPHPPGAFPRPQNFEPNNMPGQQKMFPVPSAGQNMKNKPQGVGQTNSSTAGVNNQPGLSAASSANPVCPQNKTVPQPQGAQQISPGQSPSPARQQSQLKLQGQPSPNKLNPNSPSQGGQTVSQNPNWPSKPSPSQGEMRPPLPKPNPPAGTSPSKPTLPRLQQPGVQPDAESSPSGVVVKPTHHFIMPVNQSGLPNPGKLSIRQGPPVNQMVLNIQTNQQSTAMPPPAIRGISPKVSSPLQQRPSAVQSPTPNAGPMSPTGAARPPAQMAPPSVIPKKLAPVKETAPSEASLARLTVEYMQQSLDKEIMAKKGVTPQPPVQSQPPPAQVSAPESQPVPSPPVRPPQQQNQIPYQAKPLLPPRLPIPAILDPNSSIGQVSQANRPICSVVPFTNQTKAPANSPRMTAPAQPGPTFVKPRNPAPVSAASAHHSPGFNQNQMTSQQNSFPPSTPPSPLARPPVPQGQATGQIVLQNPFSDQPKPHHEYEPQHAAPAHNPPSQQSHFKSEGFSLDRLSEDQCILTDKGGKGQGRLTTGMVYQIRSPLDQSLVLAMWNGEKFEDLSPEDVKELKSQSHMNSQANTSKVNTEATSLSKGSSVLEKEYVKKSLRQRHIQDNSWSDPHYNQDVDPMTIQQKSDHTPSGEMPTLQKCLDAPVNQSTYIKPLSHVQHRKEDLEEEEDDSVFKKPFSEDEDYFRVCNHCGYTSKNFKRCEGCKKIFQGEVKIHTLKKNTSKPGMPTPGGFKTPANLPNKDSDKTDTITKPISKDSFYGSSSPRGKSRGRGARGTGRTKGGGMKGRMGARKSEDYSNSESEDSLEGKQETDGSGSSSESPPKKRPARPKSKNPAPKKRSKKLDEPVTLTISSDEDEPSSTSNNLPQAPSPAYSGGSESPLFPSTPTQPVNAFGRFRRALMEDEEGVSKLSKKMHRSGTPVMDRMDEDEEREDEEDEECDEVPIYEIDIRSVRIGSMRTQPEGPLLINLRGVCFRVRSERTEEGFEFEILAQDVEHVKYFSGQTQPVLFLFLTQECGAKLRAVCHMEPGDDEFFDPSSTDMKQKMIVIIIECFNYMPHEMLRETLSLWADMNHEDDEYFIEELTEESANDLLIQSAPPVLTSDVERDVMKFKKWYLKDTGDQHLLPRGPPSPSDSTDNEPDSTSSSPPEIKLFMGANIRLLQYPPPPLRGIPITTEDLLCLTEGEFLNDVIIDFYLQYLFLEKFSPENRKRTHIFSSFFYKRLTQRDRHLDKTDEEAKKSLPERRHARVKKWTKTVDLFSKDFIIVPINEHSHWYLAVICFPGLAAPEVVPYIPSPAHGGDAEEQPDGSMPEENSEEGGNSGGGSTSTNQENKSRTILGRQLSPEEKKESKHEGLKQPCILMFDSLAGPSRNPNIKMLKEYLQCEWNAKKSDEEPRNLGKIIRGSSPRVPQQSNYSDCGVYLLQYVETFFEDPIGDFQIPMKGLQYWFPEDLVLNKRRYIHDLIISLHKRYQEERGDMRIYDIKFESHPREPIQRAPQNMNMNRDDENSNSSMSSEFGKDMQAPGHLFLPAADNPGNSGLPGPDNRPGFDRQHFMDQMGEGPQDEHPKQEDEHKEDSGE